jgi:hypothetical protein
MNNKKYYPAIADMIAQHYNLLHEACGIPVSCSGSRGSPGQHNKEDVFSETMLYVIYDADALLCTDPDAFVKHFVYRFRMIAYQITQDLKMLKEIPYADYLQAQKEIPETGQRS